MHYLDVRKKRSQNELFAGAGLKPTLQKKIRRQMKQESDSWWITKGNKIHFQTLAS
jgi:hypothetical protein